MVESFLSTLTAYKNEVFHLGFFSKCEQIRSFLVTFTEKTFNGKTESFLKSFLEQLFCTIESMFEPASIKRNSTGDVMAGISSEFHKQLVLETFLSFQITFKKFGEVFPFRSTRRSM